MKHRRCPTPGLVGPVGPAGPIGPAGPAGGTGNDIFPFSSGSISTGQFLGDVEKSGVINIGDVRPLIPFVAAGDVLRELHIESASAISIEFELIRADDAAGTNLFPTGIFIALAAATSASVFPNVALTPGRLYWLRMSSGIATTFFWGFARVSQ